ncbi:Cof-type HAD-IIB family hydrolase [Luedemannella helvata]|uniref:HAD family hydrolase n=1 Tax=Luedemannella helvata TaxID=349315 RepID=A0ABP4WAY8_9ACTN
MTAGARLPRLIATDLDGTLLRPGGDLSQRTAAALRSAVHRGVDVVVVTARPPRYVDFLGDRLGVPVTAICANGAVHYDIASRRIVAATTIPIDTARTVADLVESLGGALGLAVETGAGLVCEPAFGLRHFDAVGDLREVPARDLLWTQAEPLVKLMVWSGEQGADELMAAVRAVVGDVVECTHSGGAGLLEISAAGVSKAAALAAWCAERGIAAHEVVAFGDMPNDLGMLRWAGTGMAMANAHPSVLAEVPARAPANADDGVAVVIEGLLAPVPRQGRGSGVEQPQ